MDHLYQIILKSDQYFLTRRFLKFFFSFGCHGNHNSAWIEIIRTILKGDHPRIIPVKFGDNLPSVLGGDELLTDDGR